MHQYRHSKTLATALTTALTLVSATATAQDAASYPAKPVTVVIPNVSGGTTDKETRLYTQKLSERLGKPFVIEYKPGAGGSIAGVHVARAKPDGYTLLMASSSFTVTPAFATDLPYDTLKDFAPLSLMSRRPTVLVAHPDFPADNLTQYIAYAKANPGKITWGTSGVGGIAHLSGVWLHSEIGAPATFVHYKGSAQMYPDLLAGRIQVHPASVQTALANLRSGKTKALAILSPERVAQLPGVKTADEQGVKDFEQPSYLGIVTTGGTPQAIVSKLGAELVRIAKSPDIVKAMEPSGTVMVGSTPAQFSTFINREVSRWTKLVKENNIRKK